MQLWEKIEIPELRNLEESVLFEHEGILQMTLGSVCALNSEPVRIRLADRTPKSINAHSTKSQGPERTVLGKTLLLETL